MPEGRPPRIAALGEGRLILSTVEQDKLPLAGQWEHREAAAGLIEDLQGYVLERKSNTLFKIEPWKPEPWDSQQTLSVAKLTIKNSIQHGITAKQHG